ncbi:hypothetical protein C0J52_13943 [Blattella germanica]|nr:hypothetical protein C0J52_13943 [Blattella germanica]
MQGNTIDDEDLEKCANELKTAVSIAQDLVPLSPPMYMSDIALGPEMKLINALYHITRYYLSRFKDAYRQATIDMMLDMEWALDSRKYSRRQPVRGTTVGKGQVTPDKGKRQSDQVVPPVGAERKHAATPDGSEGKEDTKADQRTEEENRHVTRNSATDMEIMLKISEQVKNMIENISTNIGGLIRKEMKEAKITRSIHNSNPTPRTYVHAEKETDESNTYDLPELPTNEHSHEDEEHENCLKYADDAESTQVAYHGVQREQGIRTQSGRP